MILCVIVPPRLRGGTEGGWRLRTRHIIAELDILDGVENFHAIGHGNV